MSESHFKKIGWIGTGIMGESMASHLLAAGYSLSVHNRTYEKTKSLSLQGAVWKETPKKLAEESDIVITMLGYPQEVRDTVLGPSGVFATLKPNSILIDMTTSSPALAREMAQEGGKRQIIVLDAPVSGGDVGARNGTLSIMIGGDRKTAEQLMPIWSILGKTNVWHGQAGCGQHAKMVNQTMIAGTMIGLCESLLYATRAGLDLNKVLESVRDGAAGSWALTHLAPRIVQNDYAPGFMIEHFVKDLGIVLEESHQMGLNLPGMELAHRLYTTAKEKGLSRNGTQALYLALKEIVAS